MTDEKAPAGFELRVNAKLEVKTEVPADASGRFVHAALDAVSPLTEYLGMLGDKVRIHRYVTVQETIRRAEAELARSGLAPHPIPTKTAVRLIEHASLEEPDDELMVGLWAKLLASSATTDKVSPRFISLLSEINARQATLLADIFNHKLGRFWNVGELCDDFLGVCKRVDHNVPTGDAIQTLVDRLGPGLTDISGTVTRGGNSTNYDLFLAEEARMVDLDILDSLGLTDFSNQTSASINNLSLMVQRATITFLGDALLRIVGVAKDETFEGDE